MKANSASASWLLVGILLAFVLAVATTFVVIAATSFFISGSPLATDSTTTLQDGIDEKPYAATEAYTT